MHRLAGQARVVEVNLPPLVIHVDFDFCAERCEGLCGCGHLLASLFVGCCPFPYEDSLSGHPAPRRETAQAKKMPPSLQQAMLTTAKDGGTERAHGGELGGGSDTVRAFGAQHSAQSRLTACLRMSTRRH
jgi:hypothetical protein